MEIESGNGRRIRQKFPKRWKRVRVLEGSEGKGKGKRTNDHDRRKGENQTHGEWYQSANGSRDSGGPLQRLESNGETNQTKPNRGWNQLNRTHRERDREGVG